MMRIVVKILLTFTVLIIAVLFQGLLSQSGNSTTGIIRLIPGAILIFGIIGVWRYKPKSNTSDKTDLDKTL
jgi:hypothetical protein